MTQKQLIEFLSTTTDLTEAQASFLVSNNPDLWTKVHEDLVSIFTLIKFSKEQCKRMGIES